MSRIITAYIVTILKFHIPANKFIIVIFNDLKSSNRKVTHHSDPGYATCSLLCGIHAEIESKFRTNIATIQYVDCSYGHIWP